MRNKKSEAELNGCLWRIGKVLDIGLIVLLGFVIVGLIFESFALPRDYDRYPPPGEMVDVGGYRMHLYCTGEGEPTVIVDAGWGEYSLHWYQIQQEVAKITRICTFDRAGYAWSEPGPDPRTSGQNVAELYQLLENAGLSGQYILVGHSRGGQHMQIFASQYPELVAGLVLVDAVHKDLEAIKPDEYKRGEATLTRVNKVMAVLRRIGLLRVAAVLGLSPSEPWIDELPPELQGAPTYIGFSVNSFRAVAAEQDPKVDALSQSQFEAAGLLPDVPLIVLARGLPGGQGDDPTALAFDEAWQFLQVDLAEQVPEGELIIAEESGHNIHKDQPDLVVSSSEKIVERVKQDF